MSLDPQSGAITFDDAARLDPNEPLAVFSASTLAQTAKVVVAESQPWPTFELPPRLLGGEPFRAHVIFQGQRLFAVRLTREQPAAAGWDSWSEAAELAQQAAYERWLDAALGPAQRTFGWGSASAVFDQRAAATYISVRYQTGAPSISRS